MTRIIAGAAGGTTLNSVPGTATRPTTDRVKEALFSRLDAYGVLADARVLDLFAGSGSLGVESASRGAASVELVELAEKAADVCRSNARIVNKALRRNVVSVTRTKVETFLAQIGGPWDVVFMDPPYPLSDYALSSMLEALTPRLAEGALVVVERSKRSNEPGWPSGLELFAEKAYGETKLWFAEPPASLDVSAP
ncbi:16S rRNA (guanine(966)-N(2))-methyltransferase RsmD [Arthrobacter roseus]|uniref:16S rRNA (guanine(966)-N(2))-methyltransferase RsmD n=1 Tax=Arthrobacter roseus TaxID=136274 RepID=UPI001965BD34|nr:16S rRNA (guanine(966)-N(2))-methyltransferase RsmD [Arthrobacter roseus]MBM7848880.1 16S rRNA (guanine966-N2)-methyltransferase [Arthrobacter roseus]